MKKLIMAANYEDVRDYIKKLNNLDIDIDR
jgi:hypothetical protein